MHKLRSTLELGAAALLLSALSAPAMASATQIQVPEPGTLSLLTVGIGGAYLVSRYLRRK